MNNFKIRDLVPRPIRDIAWGVSNIKQFAEKRGPRQSIESFLKGESGMRATEEAQKMIRGALQVALFAGGFYAVRYMGWSAVTTIVLDLFSQRPLLSRARVSMAFLMELTCSSTALERGHSGTS